MATDIYCPFNCANRRESGLCDLSVVSLEADSEDGAMVCTDYEEIQEEEERNDERS